MSDNSTKPSAVRRIMLLKRQGSVFPGEIAGFPEPAASRIIANKEGYEVDENGLRIDNPTIVEPTKPEEKPATEHRFSEATDPFMTDGLSKAASHALHSISIHSVADLKAWIADEANDLDAIEGLTDTQADKIRKLYVSGE